MFFKTYCLFHVSYNVASAPGAVMSNIW